METLTFDTLDAATFKNLVEEGRLLKQRKHEELVAKIMPLLQPILEKFKVAFMQEIMKLKIEAYGYENSVTVKDIDISSLQGVENGFEILRDQLHNLVKEKGFECYTYRNKYLGLDQNKRELYDETKCEVTIHVAESPRTEVVKGKVEQ